MGKRIGWKVGNTYYDGRVATDWERLEKLEAKANESAVCCLWVCSIWIQNFEQRENLGGCSRLFHDWYACGFSRCRYVDGCAFGLGPGVGADYSLYMDNKTGT